MPRPAFPHFRHSRVGGNPEQPKRRQPRDFNDSFPEPARLFPDIERLQGTTKLRPDNQLVINRAWGTPEARLNRLVQLTKGLSAIAKRAA
jgi:hypothetical protein